jgi:hypothetical protein
MQVAEGALKVLESIPDNQVRSVIPNSALIARIG